MGICRAYLLPEADQAKIIELATVKFIPASKIGEEFNLPADTIRLFLKKEGIDLKTLQRNHFQSIAKSATEEFISGASMRDVTSKYQISSSSIENYMCSHNINYRSEHGRKNFFNQRFFQCIDSEPSAYFLGFLFADGNISGVSKSYSRLCNINLTLSAKDRIVLDNFLTAIDGSGNTCVREFVDSPKSFKPSKMATLNLTSTKMADDLISLGFCGLKSDRADIPDLPANLYNHFVRGYFEGDGCATTNTIQFTGYVGFLENLSILLSSQLNFPVKSVKLNYANKDIGDLGYYKQSQIQDLYHYMYSNANYILPRKKEQILRQLK